MVRPPCDRFCSACTTLHCRVHCSLCASVLGQLRALAVGSLRRRDDLPAAFTASTFCSSMSDCIHDRTCGNHTSWHARPPPHCETLLCAAYNSLSPPPPRAGGHPYIRVPTKTPWRQAHQDCRWPRPSRSLQRTNSNPPILRLHPSPPATMRCATTTRHRLHHDLRRNKNHT